ncbi:MAG: MXAN_5187 C-terminal domain-containing protein [Myxococcota bacterium]|nr:MXAN_5187 C-terminal domain-containing protein [Myxococcota bacterium]
MARRDRESRQIKEALELLQKFIQITKTEYEMYFLGINKVPPADKERELKRMVRELQETVINNTALKFKFKTLRARYSTLSMFWLRTCKQIEDGTYRKQRVMADIRDDRNRGGVQDASVLRDQIRALVRGEELPEHMAEKTVYTETIKDGGDAPRIARPRGVGRKGHEVGSSDLVREYASLRAKLGVKGKVDSGKLEKKLAAHAKKLKKDYGLRDVRFRVVAENGKAKLKAIPIK